MQARGYVVYTDGLVILSTNWKKKKAYDPITEPNGLRGDYPLTDAEMRLK